MKTAFISDIHEDLISLKQAMRRIEKEGCSQVACLGDISGFSPLYYDYYDTRNASECLSIIKQNCNHILLGNHDLFALKRIPEISPNFEYPENWFQLDYHQKKAFAGDRLWLNEENELDPLYKNEDMEYINSLPEYKAINIEEAKYFISHAIYPNISGCEKVFYFEYFEFMDHINFASQKDCTISFAGHFHPEGIAIANDDKFVLKGFKTIKLPDSPAAILCPAIAKGKNRNGFLIFDTVEQTLTAKKL